MLDPSTDELLLKTRRESLDMIVIIHEFLDSYMISKHRGYGIEYKDI